MADEEEVQEKKGPGIKLILIIGVVVGAAVGGGVAFFLKGSSPPPAPPAAAADASAGEEEPAETSEAKPEAEAEEAEGEGAELEEGGIFELEPFIVNLADTTKIRYLKINIKLELMKSKYADDLNARLPQIRDTLLLLLSSKEFAAIRTVEGKMELRDEVLQRVNAIFRNNKVKMAYFTDFVTQ